MSKYAAGICGFRRKKIVSRVTIIQRPVRRRFRRMPGYEADTLHNLTDQQLNDTLNELNEEASCGSWTVRRDFNLTKTAERKAYLQYCIDCYFNPSCLDKESKVRGARIVASLGSYNLGITGKEHGLWQSLKNSLKRI